jgi:copper chaperone
MGTVVEIKVEGMGCQKCVASVEGAIRRLAPESQVTVDLATGTVRIAGAGAEREPLEKAIEDAGYDIVR